MCEILSHVIGGSGFFPRGVLQNNLKDNLLKAMYAKIRQHQPLKHYFSVAILTEK